MTSTRAALRSLVRRRPQPRAGEQEAHAFADAQLPRQRLQQRGGGGGLGGRRHGCPGDPGFPPNPPEHASLKKVAGPAYHLLSISETRFLQKGWSPPWCCLHTKASTTMSQPSQADRAVRPSPRCARLSAGRPSGRRGGRSGRTRATCSASRRWRSALRRRRRGDT